MVFKPPPLGSKGKKVLPQKMGKTKPKPRVLGMFFERCEGVVEGKVRQNMFREIQLDDLSKNSAQKRFTSHIFKGLNHDKL